MKKILTYILGGVLLLALILMVNVERSSNDKRQLDTRLTLRKRDKIPYGGYIAYENLANSFPRARIASDNAAPGYWTDLSEYQKDQVLVIVAPEFKPDETEWRTIRRFVEAGNDVLISSAMLSFPVEKETEVDVMVSVFDNRTISRFAPPDSMELSLTIPAGSAQKKFVYPGHNLGTWFYKYNEATSRVLGYDHNRRPNLIGLSAGRGNLYLHLAPLAFSNYFLLHGENMEYYDKVISLLSDKATVVVWDEYFLTRKDRQPAPDKHWLSVLLNLENTQGKKPFGTAFGVLLAVLLLYVISEMRRKQRPVPVLKRPGNDSLDFVKTVGRLYHDKGDHLNLCRKMTAYFLEHVRSRYKISTRHTGETFVKDLVYKTGVEETLVRDITGFIEKVYQGEPVTAQGMAWYHEKLEQFYKQS